MASWSNKNVLDFIVEYKKHECLWQIKSKEYHNRDMKEVAYNRLLELTKTFMPDATKAAVLKKINNLRTTFRKEQKKILSSKRSGMGIEEMYVPKLWYFQEMSFLLDQEEGLTGKSNLDELTVNEGEAVDNLDNDSDNSCTENVITNAIDPQNIQPSSESSSAQRIINAGGLLPKKRFKRTKTVSPADQVLIAVGRRLCEPNKDDDCDVFAKHVAAKLRKLNKYQRLFAEKLINDTLFEAELETLTRYVTINTGSFTRPSSSASVIDRHPQGLPRVYDHQEQGRFDAERGPMELYEIRSSCSS